MNDHESMSTRASRQGPVRPGDHIDEVPPSLKVIPTVYPTSPPVEEMLHCFWKAGEALATVEIKIEPPEKPLEMLERLGPSPFPRGSFPVIGFLATTYDKVSRHALERGPEQRKAPKSS